MPKMQVDKGDTWLIPEFQGLLNLGSGIKVKDLGLRVQVCMGLGLGP